ncbi:MAG: queuosine precursor transporter [Phycisphaera sp.]|nr:queuosine precursor transporter [Phycisphaera sp.]
MYKAGDKLPPIAPVELHARRERVYLVLCGLFLGTLAMLNILGITRFLVFASITDGHWQWGQWGKISFAVAVGVLPYPMTFLCTDFISELYGRKRANFVVWVGLILNLWVIFILWLGAKLPMQPDMVSYGTNALGQQVMAPHLPKPVLDDAGVFVRFDDDWTYYRLKMLAFGAVTASMIAYMAAQFCDVYLFHFWKKITKGKHLWLRNNGSTMVSQIVDTTAVILITHFYAHALPVNPDHPIWPQLGLFIATGYAFKWVAAALDTIPFYLGVGWLSYYLRIDPTVEHSADSDIVHMALPMDSDAVPVPVEAD